MAVMVGRIINGILGFLGVLFLIIILYAGFTWMNAGGNEEDVTQARSLIKWSIIGIIIIIGAYAISFYVVDQINKATIYSSGGIPDVPIDDQQGDDMLDYEDCMAGNCSLCGSDQECCNTYPNSTCCIYRNGLCQVKDQF